MEAVPRLPMLSFELKVSSDRFPPEFMKLKQYIRDFYNEDPETYSTEIRNLETLRANAVHPAKDATGCAVMKKYFCQLHFLQSRFPIGREEKGAISFVWKDAYGGIVCTTSDIKFEMVNVLYNIGALHSLLGAGDDRTTPEGLKMACTHFQCAAWAFQHLKDSYPQPQGLDCSPDLMQFMYQLCLAQAQECILEKSMTDNRKATINAKVAAQIVDYYNLALSALLQGSPDDPAIIDIVGSKIFKSWKRYMKFKVSYYNCISLLYQGMQSEEQQKMGERIAYFQGALDKLNEAIKLSKNVDQGEIVNEALIFTRDVVEGKRKAAKNENDFIYHEDIPELDTLPPIKGASLVKGIPFSVNDTEISGPDIFARLVPMKAHEVSSLYSEEKAKLLRRISSMIDAKDEEVVSYMSSLQLEYLKIHVDSPVLPQEVVDRCAALSAKQDAIPNLVAAMDKLSDAYHDVDGMLAEIMEFIKIEEISEKEYQEIMGPRPPSIVATDLTREANKYMEAHKKAAESNETLHKAMTQHIENLRVLQQPLNEIASNLPSLESLNLKDDPAIKEVVMLVDKVTEMRKQRAMLASQLRESICSDDITAQLVTRVDERKEDIFEKEMQKHNKYVSLIEQNLAAQEKILPALTDSYAKYAPTRKAVTEIMRQREMMLSALISSYDAYEDLITKSNKGLEFYRKLETNLTKLLQRVKGTCKVQQEERDTILAQNSKKLEQNKDTSSSTTLKLKDYLKSRKDAERAAAAAAGYYSGQTGVDSQQSWLPSVRPAPLGSEGTSTKQDYTPYSAGSGYGTYPQSSYSPDYIKGYTLPYNYQNIAAADLQNLQYPSLTAGVTATNMNSPSHKSYTTNLPANTYQYPQTMGSGGYGGLYDQGNVVATSSSVQQVESQNQQPMQQVVGTQNYQSLDVQLPIHQVPGTQNYQSSDLQQQMQQMVISQNYQAVDLQQPTQQMIGNQKYQSPDLQQPMQHVVGGTQNYQSADLQQPTQQMIGTQKYQSPDLQQPMQHVVGGVQNYQSADVQQPIQQMIGTQNYQTADTQQPTQQMIGTQKYQSPDLQQPMHHVVGGAQNYQSADIQHPIQQLIGTQNYPSDLQQMIGTQNYQSPELQQPMQHLVGTQNYKSADVQQPMHQVVGTQNYQSSDLQQQTISTPNHLVLSQGQTQQYNPESGQSTYTALPSSDFTVTPQNTAMNYTSYQNQYQYNNQQQWPQQNYSYNSNIAAYNTNQTPTSNVYGTNMPQQNISYLGEQQLSTANQISQPYSSINTTACDINQSTSVLSLNQTFNLPNQMQQQYGYTPDNSYGQQPLAQGMPSSTTDYSQYYQSYTNTYPNMQFQETQSTDTSHYSSAGGKSTFETNSSSVTPEGLTYASQYVASTVPSQYQNYYSQPYGYQYTTVTHHTTDVTNAESPVQPNAVTYMQAANSHGMTMTYSQQPQSQNSQPTTPDISKQPSNLDLLTGLDFSITDSTPLQPQLNNSILETSQGRLANLSIESKPTITTEVPSVKSDNTKQSSKNGSTNSLDKLERPSPSKTPLKDPFSDPEVLSLFVQEVEKFEKFVEGLNCKTLNGPTPLDIKWNELQDLQDKDAHKQIISVARCYPMKNRFPDILPYDCTRVELPSTKDDYINASHVKELRSYAPNFIMTQAPLVSTYSDFWNMVIEQHVELIVCLLSDSQMNQEIYWAVNKTEDLVFGKIKVSLQSQNIKSHWIERIISVSEGKTSRVVVHLQFTSWPHSWMPESPGPFLMLVSEAVSVWSQQRGKGPMVVHCDSGVGKSGLFVLLVIATCDLRVSSHLPDPINLANQIASYRKNPLRDRAHLSFAYHCVLYHARDLLLKRGILASRSTFEEKRPKTKSHTRHPSEDFLLNSLKEHNEERRRSDASSTGSGTKQTNENDPLSQIDPLWPIKRFS